MPLPDDPPPTLRVDEDNAEEGDQTTSSNVRKNFTHDHILAFWPEGRASVATEKRSSVVVGRGRDCDLRIDDGSVSRRHAIIHLEPTLAIEDCGSRNGTSLGHATIPPHKRVEIPRGTVISIGEAMIVFQGVAGQDVVDPWTAHTEPTLVGRGRATLLRSEPALESKMERLNKLIDLVSKSMLSVLIVGETGVGKEVGAERLHLASNRSTGPLIKLNCAALPEQLLENELFGHERGAFTGADREKRGLVEAADGGTLFLDEVGELPMSTQAKVLRALESREVLRLGAITPRRIDVRFVSATNRNLEHLVQAGKFRADLYFRLNGITLHIPPLRERKAEMHEYVQKFIDDACKRLDRKPVKISGDAVRILESYSWPGNLRELRNVIERAVVLADGKRIDTENIMLDASQDPQAAAAAPPPSQRMSVENSDERVRIQDALEKTGGNQTAAAKLLGIARRTLVYKLGLLDLPRPRKKDG